MDEEGTNFADQDAAHGYAVIALRDLAAASVRGGHLVLDDGIVLLDEARAVCSVIRFGDVVAIR